MLDAVAAARSQSQATPAARAVDGVQLTLDLTDSSAVRPSGLSEMSVSDRVQAELEVLGLDASAHLIDFYAPMLSELGATRSSGLLACRSSQEILVAGVKVATQTPPVRSGRRVVFLTLDDGAGPIDATFFPDAQDPYAERVFHSWLLLVRGKVRRTGPRGVSLRATGCWELAGLRRLWQSQGPASVLAMLASSPHPDRPETIAESEQRPTGTQVETGTRHADIGGTGTTDTAPGAAGRRVLVYASGFRKSPYSDVRPAGSPVDDARAMVREAGTAEVDVALDDETNDPPGKLWHSSPGSSGW
jgi:error-prone DNA polymerase